MKSDVEVVVVTTNDAAEAAAAMATSFPGIRIRPAEDGAPFRFRHLRTSAGPLTVNQLSFTGTAKSRGEFPDVVAAGRVRSGRFSLMHGQEAVDTTKPYLRRRGDHSAEFEDSSVELITVQPDRFAEAADARLTGSGQALNSIGTRDPAGMSAIAAARWHSTADHIFAIASHPQLLESPLIRASLTDLFVVTMITTFPMTHVAGRPAPLGAGGQSVRRAITFMQEHAHEAITIPAVADAARLSVRGLEYAFARQFGISPHRYLRQLRLEAARDELLRSDPATTTVQQIARRWGFPHMGRFAAMYRGRFGTVPSSDLRE